MMGKPFVLISILIFHTCGTALLPKSYELLVKTDGKSLRCHRNMTSMWVVDDRDVLREIYLSAPPGDKPFGNPAASDVSYFIYTREYNGPYMLKKNDKDRLISSTFKSNRPTKVVIHGFWNNYQSDAVQIVRQVFSKFVNVSMHVNESNALLAYLNKSDVNVVAVDWSPLARGPWYIHAVWHVEPVGQEVGEFLNFLLESGNATLSCFHLLGHSLGAHVASFASNALSPGRITRITGLDPALPLFSDLPPAHRLDPSDADLIDCIHTCGGYLGFYTPLCTHDFYPNGGTASQPGCHWDLTGACSHGQSYHYFGASTVYNFTATACDSFDQVGTKQCTGIKGLMGEAAYQSKPGIYYLETKSSYPFV